MFLAAPGDLRRTRSVAAGQPSDLCLLHTTLTEALENPSAAAVRTTIAGGRVVC